MIKAKKIGLILEKEVLVDAILKNDIVIRVCCEFLDAEYDRLLLKYPEDQDQLAQYFYEGKSVEVSINTMNGRITYPAKVMYEPKDKLIVVEYYKVTTVFEQRKFFRVNATKKLKISTDNFEIDALTLNISGGGMKLMLNDELDENKIYYGLLNLSNNEEPAKVKFKVLEVRFLATEKKYEAGVEFTDLLETERKKITKFCFDIQTAMLNKK
ncbi:MAG: PilZ domain-containing protein [Candidatus Gastranaerophilales bacterium]|nr:PilZ domain-containing protein [Candidatus Gastranaerophilales bacterium]